MAMMRFLKRVASDWNKMLHNSMSMLLFCSALSKFSKILGTSHYKPLQ